MCVCVYVSVCVFGRECRDRDAEIVEARATVAACQSPCLLHAYRRDRDGEVVEAQEGNKEEEVGRNLEKEQEQGENLEQGEVKVTVTDFSDDMS